MPRRNRLPVLQDLVDYSQKMELPDLSNTVVVGVQHMLSSTEDLLEAMICTGIKPENLLFTGKAYSDSPEVVARIREKGVHITSSEQPELPGCFNKAFSNQISTLWEVAHQRIDRLRPDRIIVLDEGGHCLEKIPSDLRFQYAVAGIEQTRGGLYNPALDHLPFPVCDVARSAVKKFIEAPMIAHAVVEKLKQHFSSQAYFKKNSVIGVLGNGAVGTAIVTYFSSMGYTVLVCDENENAFDAVSSNKVYRMAAVSAVIANADIILGCTGKDVTKDLNIFELIHKPTTFVSCSSADKEFLSLLCAITQESPIKSPPLSDINYQAERGLITIVNGGYPVNFDNSPISVPSDKIQVTRGLLYAAILQAIKMAKAPHADGYTVNHHAEQLQLAPHLQQRIVKSWLKHRPESRQEYSQALLNCYDDVDWVKGNSGGLPVDALFPAFVSDRQQDFLSAHA